LAPILSEQVGWWQMGLVIGLITAAGYIVSTLGVHETPVDPSTPKPRITDGFRDAFALPPFRWYLWANLSKEYVFVVLAATLPLWRRYALGIEGEVDTFLGTLGPGEAEAVILGMTFVLAVPFLWMWKRVTPRIGVARAWLYASIVMLPGLALLALADDFMSGAIAAWVVAPGLAGYMMSPIIALSEVIDVDAVTGEERREGLFFGINGAVGKLAFTVQGVLLGVLLSVTDYDAALDAQPEAAVDAIRFLMGWSPALAALAAVWFLYRLDRSLEESRSVS
ncbi:MAG: sodium:melibiose symporter, partial [Acidimicrobiia bacterium]|nr:sodium:melibiose symporter [Acidimicrobiia bacterium]